MPSRRAAFGLKRTTMGTIVSVLTLPFRRPLVTTALLTGGLIGSSVLFGPISTLQGVTRAATAINSAYAAAKHTATGMYWHFTCPGRMAAIKRMGSVANATPEQLLDAARVKQACTPT